MRHTARTVMIVVPIFGLRLATLRKSVFVWLLPLFVLTFLFLLPAFCHSLRYSLYYRMHPTKEREIEKLRQENNKRLQQAREYVHSLAKASPRSANWQLPFSAISSNESIDVAITIVSVSRNRHRFDLYEPHYLTQVAWKYSALLRSAEAQRKKFQVFLCNVDKDPDNYKELKNLSSFFPAFHRRRKKVDKFVNIFEKEKQDYAFCLNATIQTLAKYILLVEDDGFPHDDVITILNFVIETLVEGRGKESGTTFPQEWYMKLYHPERLLGYYSLEQERIPELLSLSSFFSSLIVIICYYGGMQRVRMNVYTAWFGFFIYFCLLFIAVGRQNVCELRRISKYLYLISPAPSCCTPAILYPNKGAKSVVSYLNTITCKNNFAKDIALEKLRETGFQGYLVQPNLFKHIGLYSTLREHILDPFVV